MDPDTPHPTVDLDGRTFLAAGPSVPVVYPLPVDIEKLDTYDRLHYTIQTVVGNNYHFDEVGEMLAADSDPSWRKRAVDLGCGTGVWLREMAEEFPHVHFTGVDIVDCWDQLEDDLENIEFVLDDIKGRTRFPDNTFDLVHMRQMRLTVTDFPALLSEIARILRPGGLLLSGEWGRNSMLEDSRLDIRTYAPAIVEFNELLAEILNRKGPFTLAEEVLPLIRASGHFVDMRRELLPFPTGPCQAREHDAALGADMGEQMFAHFDSLRHLLLDLRPAQKIDALKADVLRELNTKSGIVCCFYIAVARKAAP